ncbi:hypothetical protein MW925_000590 [Salmonella enterica]|nr:hypothetical protein [Salmonella enterica]ELW8654290.1 hypothetical protein [Salmonella enterica]
MKIMKMNHTSLSRKWILFSLVLLSPEILAATESLNFNYKRADTLSLEPRLGLQARACHSLADPMNIEFQFSEMTPPEVELHIKGNTYIKGYSIFRTASGVKVTDAYTDPDFQVPWHIQASGQVSGQVAQNSPAVQEKWNYPFCFSDGHPFNRSSWADNAHANGYFPVFRPDYFKVSTYWQVNVPLGLPVSQDDYNWSQWHMYCDGKDAAAHGAHYGDYLLWDGDPKDRNSPPPAVKHQMDISNPPGAFLTKNWFFVSHIPGRAEGEGPDIWGGLGQPVPDDSKSPDYVYRFPIKNSNNKKATVLNSGRFSFRLDNRNITSLTLIIKSNGLQSAWVWARNGDNTSWLHLSKTGNIPVEQVSNRNDPGDPYSVGNFYTRTQSYFKGTLVAKSFLNSQFTNHVPPLSLPPDSDGDINLVNTDSLMFSIGQVRNSCGQGNWTVSVQGQPLKFAPVYVNGKEVVSAMQVRNACY